MRVSLTLPIRLVSEANAHEHWRNRQKRAKAQRTSAWAHVRSQLAYPNVVALPAVVEITRIAPRALDSDNAVGSAKHIRDGIAEALGLDDRDPRVTWVVHQERGAPGYYGVRIEISATPIPLTESRTHVAGNGAEGGVDPRKVPRNKSASGDRARDSGGRK